MNKQTREEQILKESIEVFVEEGYHDTKMDSIAKRVGVAKGTLYQYFPSKLSLFRKIITNETGKCLASYQKILSKDISFKEKIRELFNFNLKLHSRFGRLYRVQGFWTALMRKEAIDIIIEFMHKRMALIAQASKEAIENKEIQNKDPEIVALHITSLMESSRHIMIADKKGETIVAEMIELTFEGLK